MKWGGKNNLNFPYQEMKELKGMYFDHDFYVVVLLVNYVVQKMRRWVTNTISLHRLTNFLLLFICFKLVLSF